MTLRDDVKQFVREQRAASASTIPPPRIGLCTQVNSDGTISVLLEGSTVNVRNPYGAVTGQDILLLPDQNGVFSVGTPTRPTPQQAEFIPATLFTAPAPGGLRFVSFVGVQDGDARCMVGFQDAGSRKLYWLAPSDDPSQHYWDHYYYTFAFSPNTKFVAFFGTIPAGDYWYVYELGASLKSLGLVPGQDEIYYLDATLTRSGPVGSDTPVSLWVDNDGVLYWVTYNYSTSIWKLYKSDGSGTTLVATQDFSSNPLVLDPYAPILDGTRSRMVSSRGDYTGTSYLCVYIPVLTVIYDSSPKSYFYAGVAAAAVTSKFSAGTFYCDTTGGGMGEGETAVVLEDLASGAVSLITCPYGGPGHNAPLTTWVQLVEGVDKGYTMWPIVDAGIGVHRWTVVAGIMSVDSGPITGISTGDTYPDSIRLAFYTYYGYSPPYLCAYPNWGLIGS